MVRRAVFYGVLFLCGACRKEVEPRPEPPQTMKAPSATPAASSAPPTRPGMAWIPPGVLRAGTPPHLTPRIADEELPGTEISLEGFFIDVMPYPNESGAIPTTHVTREKAEQLCGAKGKRLCTELEWERACKGPENTAYEYGDAYKPQMCGTGVPVELAASRPTGERTSCKSGFGVLDMHGGAWEWTSSPWARGPREKKLASLRGGNAEAGEIVGRCANALGRPASAQTKNIGFRCCAGTPNTKEVELTLSHGQELERDEREEEAAKPFASLVKTEWAQHARWFRAWTWRPVANEELTIVAGCSRGDTSRVRYPTNASTRGLRCGTLIGRVTPAGPQIVREVETASFAAEAVLLGASKKLRVRWLEGDVGRASDLLYLYGRVEPLPQKP